MSIEKPSKKELEKILGKRVFKVWEDIEEFIFQNYDMDTLWNIEKKTGDYEYKFRKNSRTLVTLYSREKYFGLMMIFGVKERNIFAYKIHKFSEYIVKTYDKAKTYHDGKWVMFDIYDDNYLDEYKELIKIKYKPNKK